MSFNLRKFRADSSPLTAGAIHPPAKHPARARAVWQACSRAMANGSVGDHVVPREMAQSKQKACMSCSLIKTVPQFVEDGCDNCPFMGYQSDRERVLACTTSSFTGSYVALKPTSSWVAKWQRVSRFVPGAYAVSIEAKMPDDIIELLEQNRIRIHAVLATSEKTD